MADMKKTARLSIAIVLALAAMALFGCATESAPIVEPENSQERTQESPQESPETPPQIENPMALACQAVRDDPDYASRGISVAYNSDRLDLELKTGFTEADAAWVMDIMAPILQGQDVRLILRTANDDVVLPLEQFTPYFDFASLELSFDGGHCLRQATGMDTLANVSCLKSLDIGYNEPGILPILPQLETLSVAPFLKELGRTATFSFTGIENQPALQTLIVKESDNGDILFVDLEAVSRCANLRELRILQSNKLASLEDYTPNSARDYFLCEAALACPTFATIQDQPAGSFSLQAVSSEEGREDYRARVDAVWSSATLHLREGVRDRYSNGEIALMGSIPTLDTPFILFGVDNDGSIPDEYLRNTLEGGDVRYLVIVDTRPGEVVKHYTNGGEGYETITYLYIYDITNDLVSPETIVATTMPPDSFVGSVGSNVWGEKQPQAALPYIVGLLG